MKNFKRFMCTLMATVIAAVAGIIPQTVSAENNTAEVPDLSNAKVVDVQYSANGERTTTYELDVQPDALNGSFGIMPLSIDQSFTMTTYHRGGDRKYYHNYLDYYVTITDTNGNAVNNIVQVCLRDYNGNRPSYTNVAANGSTGGPANVPIVYGRTYYFTYTLVSGTARNLRVRMIIVDHN